MSGPDFIEVYDDALPAEACAELIRRFERSGQSQPGRVGSGLMPELKDSDDIEISARPDWKDVEQLLNAAVLNALKRYVSKYRYALIAPLMLEIPDPVDGTRRRIRAADFDGMPDEMLSQLLGTLLRPGSINLQRYRAGKGGYPYWHCEQYPRSADADTLHRMLLWTIYLNDGFGDGETEFLYQERRITPRAGSLLIAPTAFTHTHRGNTPRHGDKYIATSWVLFQRAELMFGPPQG